MPARASNVAKKKLFIAFDAFGTLFTPRAPIGALYGQAARRHGVCTDVGDEEIMRSFKTAFKNNSQIRPNYGKEVGMDPTVWWGHIITDTLQPFLSSSSSSSSQPAALPPRLIPDLLTHFASHDAYTLYPDVIPTLKLLRNLKESGSSRADGGSFRFDRAVVAIVTNSDNRVAGILRSFGLRIGHVQYGDQQQKQQHRTAAVEPEANDVDFVLTSYDCGFEKPHGGIFAAARELLVQRFGCGGCGAEEGGAGDGEEWEMVYVGDELAKDVAGAEGAGWAAFLIDRERHLDRVGEQRRPVRDEGWMKVVKREHLSGVVDGPGDERDVRVLEDLGKLYHYLVDAAD